MSLQMPGRTAFEDVHSAMSAEEEDLTGGTKIYDSAAWTAEGRI